jgi:3alpha(or 20beta)-hydroxysteroid dehydrogenase
MKMMLCNIYVYDPYGQQGAEMSRLDGKVAIVTGGGRGLGRAIAELFAAEGAAVLIADIDDGNGETAASAITAAGGRALFQHLDVTSERAWSDGVARCRAELGTPDVLVSNALAWLPANVGDVTTDDWRLGLEVMLNGSFFGIRAVLPGMREQRSGAIVSVGSVIGGNVAIPAYATYQAAKGGIVALTRHVAATYGADGIRANTLLPGPMYTEGLADSGFTESAEGIAATFPLARIAQPQEVAAGALFLASDESSYMTGVAMPVDGGQVAV